MPAQVVAPVVPSLTRRLASMAYEGLLLIGVLATGFLVPHLVLGIGLRIVLPGWLLVCHIFALLGGYFVWHWRRAGQTLAMRTWRLLLSTPTGMKPTLARLVWRYTLAWPGLGMLGASVIWALIDRDRQFLHDRLAGTRLVIKPE